MVVASQQHIEARVQGGGGDAVGAVEQGVTLVGVGGVVAPEGGFQVGDGIVCLLDIGGHMGEQAVEDPGTGLIVPAALEHRLMHQQVAGDGEAGSGYDHLRFHRNGGGRNGGGGHGGLRHGLGRNGGGDGLSGVLTKPVAEEQNAGCGGSGQQNQDQHRDP